MHGSDVLIRFGFSHKQTQEIRSEFFTGNYIKKEIYTLVCHLETIACVIIEIIPRESFRRSSEIYNLDVDKEHEGWSGQNEQTECDKQ